MRWQDLDGPRPESAAQPVLFGGFDGAVVERRPGRGQFLGMEFLHVRARTILNTLPAGSRLPFRHTINAYRGCSHACTYCFARPSHAWLDLNIAEGFERQVVVKVNAVERLRVEIAPRRWAGEPIAMGTNTDPYQRCEAIYRLTRGLLEVLAAARNPFSILTKSTLVVRDLDVLAEAARRTDVAVNLSIGTLDPEVWRATEPGTPHPQRRLEVVARLNQAGIRCGVLVAPVLPGLSDGPGQLDAVVAGAVAAGAATISGGQLVHLRPGTRGVFLTHLARTHPHLVARYQAWYPGAYASREASRRVSRLLADSLRRHRGTPVALAPTGAARGGRRPATAAAITTAPAPTQLGWDL